MRGIKIPQQEFAQKLQGEAYVQWGVFVGHYGIIWILSIHATVEKLRLYNNFEANQLITHPYPCSKT